MSKDEPLIWGVAAIGRRIGRSPATTARMLENREIPGASRLADRWVLNPVIFDRAINPRAKRALATA
jgi:hypothetical protein